LLASTAQAGPRSPVAAFAAFLLVSVLLIGAVCLWAFAEALHTSRSALVHRGGRLM